MFGNLVATDIPKGMIVDTSTITFGDKNPEAHRHSFNDMHIQQKAQENGASNFRFISGKEIGLKIQGERGEEIAGGDDMIKQLGVQVLVCDILES